MRFDTRFGQYKCDGSEDIDLNTCFFDLFAFGYGIDVAQIFRGIGVDTHIVVIVDILSPVCTDDIKFVVFELLHYCFGDVDFSGIVKPFPSACDTFVKRHPLMVAFQCIDTECRASERTEIYLFEIRNDGVFARYATATQITVAVSLFIYAR